MEVFRKHFWMKGKHKQGPDNIAKQKQKINREVKTLQLLEKNFINEPEIDHYPFPKLISTEVCETHIDRPCYTVTMTHCGIDAIQNIKLVKKQREIIQPKDLYNTIECIITNLCNVCLKHHDIKGQNICINEKGQVSLIDFDGCDPDTASAIQLGHYISATESASLRNKINNFYKKPNLNELKSSCLLYTNSFNEEFTYMRKIGKLEDFYKRFSSQPWSMYYMF